MERRKMKDGEGQPKEKYGKKKQKEWNDNILPEPNPWTSVKKEEKHR